MSLKVSGHTASDTLKCFENIETEKKANPTSKLEEGKKLELQKKDLTKNVSVSHPVGEIKLPHAQTVT